MASSTVTIIAQQPQASAVNSGEIEAAISLLCVRPSSTSMVGSNTYPLNSSDKVTQQSTKSYTKHSDDIVLNEPFLTAKLSPTSHGFVVDSTNERTSNSCNECLDIRRLESAGLETLASLALREETTSPNRPLPSFLLPNAATTSANVPSKPSSFYDDVSSPLRNNTNAGRLRSVSNPEGMEKWDAYGSSQIRSNRLHFVLPASILEEELAEANEAVRRRSRARSPISSRSIPEHSAYVEEHVLSTSHAVNEDSTCEANEATIDVLNEDTNMVEEVVNDMPSCQSAILETTDISMDPEKFLQRARSRLLEELSSDSCGDEKGFGSLPHTLAKYKEIYNRNGRIGIYTPSERAAIIARFHYKRSRRNWNKKIRYNCRKNLADRRLRVKGRFVKRSEQEELAKKIEENDEKEFEADTSNEKEISILESESDRKDSLSETDFVNEVEEGSNDENMLDTNDPDAGFIPTDDQPYRRLRRHTIT